MPGWLLWLLIGLVALVGTAWLARPAPSILVRDDAGRVVARMALSGGPVILRFRHSMYDALTTEEFTVQGEELVLRRLSSERLAALEYYGRAEAPVVIPGGYAIEGLTERHRVINVLASPVGQRTLLHGDDSLELFRLPGADGPLRLSVTHEPWVVANGWSILGPVR